LIETDNIIDYYTKIFKFKRYAGYNMDEINKMYPYELEINSALTINALEEENRK